MVFRSANKSFVTMRRNNRARGREKDTGSQDSSVGQETETGSESDESQDGSSLSLSQERRVTFHVDSQGSPIVCIHSYPSLLDSGSRQDLFLTSAEMQKMQSEHLDFAKAYWKRNPHYAQCVEALYREEQSYLAQSKKVECLIQSPCRGLEHHMASCFRIQRQWMQRRILGLQGELGNISSSDAELVRETSEIVSRPSREFALKLALMDAQVAASFHRHDAEPGDDGHATALLSSLGESSSSLIDI